MKTNPPSQNGVANKWLTTADIMQQFGVTARTVRRWRKDGLPSINTGTPFTKESEIIEWMKKRKEEKRR